MQRHLPKKAKDIHIPFLANLKGKLWQTTLAAPSKLKHKRPFIYFRQGNSKLSQGKNKLVCDMGGQKLNMRSRKLFEVMDHTLLDFQRSRNIICKPVKKAPFFIFEMSWPPCNQAKLITGTILEVPEKES